MTPYDDECDWDEEADLTLERGGGAWIVVPLVIFLGLAGACAVWRWLS